MEREDNRWEGKIGVIEPRAVQAAECRVQGSLEVKRTQNRAGLRVHRAWNRAEDSEKPKCRG